MESLKVAQKEHQSSIERYWETAFQSAQNKIAVLVEGDDDKAMLEAILSHRRKTWATAVSVIAAGSRDNVLKKLRPSDYGLVDRDTWDEETASKKQAEHGGRLYVTAGWCLENLFFNPEWLKTHYVKAAEELSSQREQWVRAGALWWVLQRAREAQQAWQQALPWDYGKPPSFDLSSGAAVTVALKARIPHKTRDDASFDAESIGRLFQERLDHLLGRSESDQWQVGVHGKAAFKNLLLPALQKLGLQSDNWRVELAGHLDHRLPSPLNDLVALVPT